MVQGTQSFRQVWPARYVLLYILVVCTALEVDVVGYVLRGPLPALI